MKNYKTVIKNKTILITGGTGSFGHEVVKTLLSYAPKRIIIFSRDEKKQHDMRNKYDSPLLKFVIGDVRDKSSLDAVMSGVNYVFHASALKQVPTCEFFPLEAIKTNILGAQNVIDSAIEHGVSRIVALSTDKAVYPINAMGMTKALMEKLMIAKSKSLAEDGNKSTVICTVRYGNVLYTRGSVVPYFVELIHQNKKLPVTNFSMTRFLLPLWDAVDLVLYALTNGENGYTYVRQSPAATLKTIAEAVSDLFNHTQGYYEVGIRAGEKLHETLIGEEELVRSVDLGDYYKIPPESQGLDYNKYFYTGKKSRIEKFVAFTSENTDRLTVAATKKLLLTLPEVQEELKIRKQKKT